MEYVTVEVKVQKAMQTYFTDDYIFETGEELKRNSLLLYHYFDMDIGDVMHDIVHQTIEEMF